MNTFGLTIDTSTPDGVDGKTLKFEMTETGTFAAINADMLDYSAWDALSDEEKAALCNDARAASGWSYGKQDSAS